MTNDITARKPRRVGSYRDAIDWLAWNDDNDWLDDEHGHHSVCASLVADVFGRTREEVAKALRAAIAKGAQP